MTLEKRIEKLEQHTDPPEEERIIIAVHVKGDPWCTVDGVKRLWSEWEAETADAEASGDRKIRYIVINKTYDEPGVVDAGKL